MALFNFPEPIALHDYRYLGEDFRERERIKRKKQRWVNRLHVMPALERRALLNAITEAWKPGAGTARNSDDAGHAVAYRRKWRYRPARASPPKVTMRDPIAGNDDDGTRHRCL